jgi:hypothetical protein
MGGCRRIENVINLCLEFPKRLHHLTLVMLWMRMGFLLQKKVLLGTHSIRKFSATYTRRNGCQTDDIDARGRWKRKRGVVDRYIDVAIPYADAKVASILAIGGPIKYCPRLGAGILDN